MEHQYSRLVDPLEYQLEGLEGLVDDIPLRQHIDAVRGDIGAIRAQEDWQKLVSPLENFTGGLAFKFSFVPVTMPDCIPDRLEIISYANEFAYIHDGMTTSQRVRLSLVILTPNRHHRYCHSGTGEKRDEFPFKPSLTACKSDQENDNMLEAFREVVQNATVPSTSQGKRQIQMRMLREMMAIDRDRASVSIQAWEKFLQLAAGRQHDVYFTSLKEYIPYRILDVGEM